MVGRLCSITACIDDKTVRRLIVRHTNLQTILGCHRNPPHGQEIRNTTAACVEATEMTLSCSDFALYNIQTSTDALILKRVQAPTVSRLLTLTIPKSQIFQLV